MFFLFLFLFLFFFSRRRKYCFYEWNHYTRQR
jgi:hypothetical protein